MNVSDYNALYAGEAEEILQALENGVIGLEADEDRDACIEELFRNAHNLKGISGAMGYEAVVEASHSLENVLDRFRREEIELSQEKADLLLLAIDILRWLVQRAVAGDAASDGSERLEELISVLDPLCTDTTGKKKGREKRAAPAGGPETDTSVVDLGGGESAAGAYKLAPGITSTRVELEVLDRLMDRVGELIINRIRLMGIAQEFGSKVLIDKLAVSERLISEIQREVMEIRLVPVGQVFQRFKRLVRDVSREMEKRVELEIIGADIGIDRTVLEGMVDPLVHLIRNALDHGIETPKKRLAAGKPETAKIVLSASRERNFVVIVISDDGRGIDFHKVKKLGEYEGLSDRTLERLSEEDLCKILTAPGFSTAKSVDRLSGRGMGMNIVKRMVDSLGGTMHIHSATGKGTKISLHLPVNLSIIKALLFYVGEDVHALPVEYVKETTRVEFGSFKTVRGREVLQLKGKAIPVLRPCEMFGFAGEHGESRFHKVIIVDIGDEMVGLVINQILGQQDVVIKGLPDMIRGVSGISGATILGSGKIAFIWDPKALFEGRYTHGFNKEAVVLTN